MSVASGTVPPALRTDSEGKPRPRRSSRIPSNRSGSTYRGAAVEQHSRPKTRLECVVGADHASTVVETVLKDGDERSFVFVVPVEGAYPAETVKTDDVAAPAG